MAPVLSRIASHERDIERSARILQKARDDALKSRGYQSAPTRARLRTEFSSRNDGMVAYDWQINVAEALLLGVDCTVIAGTGAGKTMPFVMPLFVETEKIMVIISPLNALEEDQASRFEKMGISAVAINGETYNDKVHKEIEQLKHRVIITSPDMCLQHDRFRQLLSSPAFAKKIGAFIIDEAHCISQWGDAFRPVYAELGTLRAFVPVKVPFLVTSATLPPLVLAQVRAVTHINTDSSYHINLGTDRPNIAWFVHLMNGAKSDLEALAFLIPPHATDEEIIVLIQTMVFFDDIGVAMEALKWIRSRIPSRMWDQIAVYNSRRSRHSKAKVLQQFREGKIKILLTTEAAGMGCDISHVEQVVQFMVPGSLPIWMQRAGRAGRNPLITARAILLVQPSVFQEMKPGKNVDVKEGDAPKYRKDLEEGLRDWIETEDCRRDVADEYFNSGMVRTAPAGICCDNCLRKTSPHHPLLTPRNPIPTRPQSPDSDIEDSLPDTLNENGKRTRTTVTSTPNRRQQHLKGARELLVKWRSDTCIALYNRRPWGIQALLSDTLITSFATKARLQTVDDLVEAGWSPTHAAKHGEAIVELLARYDRKFHRLHDAEKEENARKKKEETAARQEERREAARVERARAREIRARQPKTPRPSRAKPKPKVFVASSFPNIAGPSSIPTVPAMGRENERPRVAGDEASLVPSGAALTANPLPPFTPPSTSTLNCPPHYYYQYSQLPIRTQASYSPMLALPMPPNQFYTSPQSASQDFSIQAPIPDPFRHYRRR